MSFQSSKADRDEISESAELIYPGLNVEDTVDSVENDFEDQFEENEDFLLSENNIPSYNDPGPNTNRTLRDKNSDELTYSDFIDNPNSTNEEQYIRDFSKKPVIRTIRLPKNSEQILEQRKIVGRIPLPKESKIDRESEDYEKNEEARRFNEQRNINIIRYGEDIPYDNTEKTDIPYADTEEIDYDSDNSRYSESEEQYEQDGELQGPYLEYGDDKILSSINTKTENYRGKPMLDNIEKVPVSTIRSTVEKTDISKIKSTKSKYIVRKEQNNENLTLAGAQIEPREKELVDEVMKLLVRSDCESLAMFDIRYNFTLWILENLKIDLKLGAFFDGYTIVSYGRLLLNKFWKNVKYNNTVEEKLSEIIKVCPDIEEYLNYRK